MQGAARLPQKGQTMTRSTDPNDHDLIQCAQDAWKGPGRYPLEGWTVKLSDYSTWVIAYGRPPKAKHDYTHIFLFSGNWRAGHYCYDLEGIAKAPWQKSVKSQGKRFVAGDVVAYFNPGQWTAAAKNTLDHEREKHAQDTHQTCCTRCHTCGAELQHIDPDLLWCEKCETYR